MSEMDLTFFTAKCYTNNVSKTPNRKGNKQMAVNTATYKVGDLYTSQKSQVTGTMQEITRNKDGQSVRIKLDVDGKVRYTTWTAK